MTRARRGYRCPKCGYPSDDLVTRRICTCPECGVTFVQGRRRDVPSYVLALHILTPLPLTTLVLSLGLGVSMFGTPGTTAGLLLLTVGFVGGPCFLTILNCAHRRMLGDEDWLPHGLMVAGTIYGVNVLLAIPTYVGMLFIAPPAL